MQLIDWCIFIIPLIAIMLLGIYCQRYIRNVLDFLAAGRVAGRFVLSVSSSAASGMGLLILIGMIEANYATGFALGFWNNILFAMAIIIALTGFVTYRYREMKVLSFGQFIEERYDSKVLRIVAAVLRSSAEIMASMLAPAVAARFFIYLFDLPQTVNLCGWSCSTYVIIVTAVITLALTIILCGGVLGLMVTDCLQGLIIYPGMACIVIFILCKFSWFGEMAPVMLDRGPGESFLNPYDVEQLRDFNLFAFLVTVFSQVFQRASWIGGGSATAAKSSHEQKMAGVFGQWSMGMFNMMSILLGLLLVTFFNHIDFAADAKIVRDNISTKVIEEIIPDQAVQKEIKKVVTAIPPHQHIIGQDAPLTQKNNLDTPYLQAVEQQIVRHDISRIKTQEFSTLYHQLMLPFSLRYLLPSGLMGIFALMMILMMLSTDDTRIYCSGTTIAQDIILPFFKKAPSPRQHLWLIRGCTLLVGGCFLVGSIFMKQLDYLNMFVTIVCSIWTGGCAPVMLGGMYCKYGNKVGAYCSLLSGMSVSFGGILLQRNWADVVYPFLEEHQLVSSVGLFLKMVSAPLNPLVVWEINPNKCPINAYEFFALAMIISLIFYIVGSYLTYQGPFNMDKMLHRSIYNVDHEAKPKIEWQPRLILRNLIGITPEYTFWDRFAAWFSFGQQIVLTFFIGFVGVVIWNLFSPWDDVTWSWYFLIYFLIIPGVLSFIFSVIFTIGGWRDLFRLFRDLEHRKVDPNDNGMVARDDK